MPARPVTKLQCFFYRYKKYAVFFFHPFARLAMQGSVNLEFFIPAKTNFFLPDLLVQFFFTYFFVMNHY